MVGLDVGTSFFRVGGYTMPILTVFGVGELLVLFVSLTRSMSG